MQVNQSFCNQPNQRHHRHGLPATLPLSPSLRRSFESVKHASAVCICNFVCPEDKHLYRQCADDLGKTERLGMNPTLDRGRRARERRLPAPLPPAHSAPGPARAVASTAEPHRQTGSAHRRANAVSARRLPGGGVFERQVLLNDNTEYGFFFVRHYPS
jgi:hypothetical protein